MAYPRVFVVLMSPDKRCQSKNEIYYIIGHRKMMPEQR